MIMPLGMVRPGEVATVVGLNGGMGLCRKLADMGLTPGVSLKVVHSQGRGPILIDVRGSRIALGFGVAQKVVVNGGG
jgi:Fe2+ transport system protein FeoA